MAYTHGYPLLVIVEAGLREEGLLERGNDWYVQRVKPTPASLTTTEFNGVFASWKELVMSSDQLSKLVKTPFDVSQMTTTQLLGALKPAQLWSIAAAQVVLIGGAFSLGARLLGAH